MKFRESFILPWVFVLGPLAFLAFIFLWVICVQVFVKNFVFMTKKLCLFLNDRIKNTVFKFTKIPYLIIGILSVLFIGMLMFGDGAWYYFMSSSKEGEHFQWVGISAVVAGTGLVINAIDNRRKFKADLISKSRITWMNELKPLIAEYTTIIRQYMLAESEIQKSKIRYYDAENAKKKNCYT